eukprot:scaffold282173_cov13-Tisochrysis_lutea.AAC.1
MTVAELHARCSIPAQQLLQHKPATQDAMQQISGTAFLKNYYKKGTVKSAITALYITLVLDSNQQLMASANFLPTSMCP